MKPLALALGCGVLMLAAMAQADTVRIATDATFPPFEYIDDNGELAGFDIDLTHEVCQRAGLDCELIAAAWDGMIPGLLARRYDALVSSLTVTEERERIMAFSDVYQFPVFRFVARVDSDIDISTEGLAGKVIAVQSGTPMDAFVTDQYDGVATIQRYDSGSAAYLDLVNGRADLHMSYEAQIQAGFLSDGDNAERFALVGPSFTGQDNPALGRGVAAAFHLQSDELREAFNAGLADIMEDGTLERLNMEYFGNTDSMPQ